MRELVVRVWESKSAAAVAARAVLAPFSWLFRLVVAVRARLYSTGSLHVSSVDTPVVSVGNIVVGGSGKTPLVIWLTSRLADLGLRTVIVTRGYGADTREPVAVYLGGDSGDDGPTEGANRRAADLVGRCGDEAVLMAMRTHRPVVAARRRHAGCVLAEQRYRPDVILLDDGFQHLSLARDVDIVVLRGNEGSAAMLPAGPLRESRRALERADIVAGPLGRVALGLVESSDLASPVEPLSMLEGKRVVAVAGIADPAQFFETLEREGAILHRALGFPDHHAYSDEDWRRIALLGKDADFVVTTEKDIVRLDRFDTSGVRLRAVRIGIDAETVEPVLSEVIERLRDRRDRVGRLDREDLRQHHRKPCRGATSRGV